MKKIIPLGILALPAMLAAQITANFTGGIGTTQTDQFTGTSGDGWSSPWNSSFSTSDVLTADQINGGNEYLSLTADGSTSSIGRTYDGVNTMSPHSVSFDIRIDSSVADFVAGSSNIEINGGFTWYLGLNFSDLNWYIQNPSQVDTGISLQQGVVYSFDFDVDPLAGLYSGTLTDGTDTFEFNDFGFLGSPPRAVEEINFELRGGNANPLTASIDNISIVPEPSMFLLPALAFIFALTRRHRG